MNSLSPKQSIKSLTTRRAFIASLLVSSLSACAVASRHSWQGSSPQISPGKLLEQIEANTAPLILDVRTAEEYAEGHIPNAINIPVQVIEQWLDKIAVPPEGEIVIYCEHGARANIAEDALYAAGFQSIFHLAGNMSNWRKQGFPIAYPSSVSS